MTVHDDHVPDAAEPRIAIATRAAAPTPRRLSRKALATLAGVSALGVAAALGYSLTMGHRSGAPQQTVSVERRNADALADAPKDYAEVARNGPSGIGPPPDASAPIAPNPFPGASPGPPAEPASQSPGGTPEQQRRREQRESARASKLFAGTADGVRPALTAGKPPSTLSGQPGGVESASGGKEGARDERVAFVAGGAREPTINGGRVTAPAGRFVVSAGSTIAAAMITALSSDLPGQVIAQVTEDVFDSASGQTRLIPQGTRLIGSYDARVSYGQSRALVVWTRMILPDGRSIDLDRLVGTDAAGQSGFADRVDNHSGKLLIAGLLSTLFGVGANAATAGGGSNSDIAYAIRESAGRSVENAGDKIVGRQLDVAPTITVRAGARVRILVSRDLVLVPWTGN